MALELVREVIPSTRRVVVLAHEVDPFGKLFVDELQEGARNLGIETPAITVRKEEELEGIFADVANTGAVQPSIGGKV